MTNNKDEIQVNLKKWEENKVNKSLSKFSERKEIFTFDTGEEVKRLYTPIDVNMDYEKDLGYPGQYPFTRGVQPTMYRSKFWTMRMYAGFATAEESNKRYKYLIEQGSMGLSVAFDLPTQMGYDSDDDISEGEVGKVGVCIDSLADMEILFDSIPLDKVSTSMTINAPASVLLAMYIAVAKKQGVSADKLRGTIQNDILKEYVARGTYIFPVKPSMRLITDIFEYCSKEVPKWNTISISGYHIREAGANAVQEVAFTLADGIAYVNSAIEAGLNVDDFAPRLSFFFNAHNNLLEEVAKFRAARRLWAKIMKERFNAQNPKSWSLKFHTQTAGCTLTAQQPENNIVRVAIQTLAAVLGGTQSLHTNSKDEALALPTEDSVRVALRTQQIVANESGVADSIDPLAGSYYVESLTNNIEQKALELINKIDNLGGAPQAIEKGFIQQEIMNSAYRYQKEIENNERIIVGVNKFQIEEEAPKGLLKVDPMVGERQKEKIRKLKESRDNEKVQKNLEALRKACNSNENIMPYILDAVESYATLGEICKVMRAEFGEYKQTVMI
ncbi:methylmalonyl-CoA mutase family protein [Romboutsia sp. 1001216sp1]|uniref:acyl-CoA mutase large subunit family protein n=1 Tax=Romboutsia TaxID=1501226 RepID=UPI000A75537B|nr:MULTISPECIES: methylmalonyl-CoA mutase family protein [Romboutsia]MDB8791526.1 methylmalonyl-CoA mutase family protein [Romboutsia sp. 1001216sp1]MDB8794476.1 methylmalonyl-CoA mutase family protein [Romboutsia sp. 1001216sp1]MDB8797492.1 methylmalonyl-CoA mutase family protein [Romboutsia sp. 1001216sp1]MDB8797747.1 methylmalonyl-CoA mutase family protein [Romboutsia sp. 1001216sp1]MDB8801480.1 methylmalonyl-CoA mutase family protein [Romboutsia sp. 1001216sp1]